MLGELLQGTSRFMPWCKGHGDGIAGQTLAGRPSNINDGLNFWFENEAELIDTVLNGNERMPARRAALKRKMKNFFAYTQEINQ